MDEEITMKALLERIRGWRIQSKALKKEARDIQQRIKEAQIKLDVMLDDYFTGDK